MWDGVRGFGKAVPELIEYRYREKFHLSHKEFLDEPLDVLSNNLRIMDMEATWREDKSRREKLKHGN